MASCLIVGGGVVGLSLAYELACRGWKVRVLERQATGQEASWAGAGILPPANPVTAVHPLDRLRGLSFQLHAEWAERLRGEAGIDTEYRVCGGLYLARTAGEAASLHGMAALLGEEQVAVERLAIDQLSSQEPQLRDVVEAGRLRVAYRLPDEAQLRNPRHLTALRVAGERRGVEFLEQAPVTDFVVHGDEWRAAVVGGREYSADRFCVTAGAWTGKLLERAGVSVGVLPIRGQMALWKATPGLLRHIINEGPRYIVPRLDGHILAGSTEEEAGFDKRTTDEGVRGLVEFAHQYVPALRSLPLARSWAGLRPGVYDGLPFLGEIPGFRNAFLAAGHFRSGLYLSPGTAVSLAACIAGERPPIDLSPFRVSRA